MVELDKIDWGNEQQYRLSCRQKLNNNSLMQRFTLKYSLK